MKTSSKNKIRKQENRSSSSQEPEDGVVVKTTKQANDVVEQAERSASSSKNSTSNKSSSGTSTHHDDELTPRERQYLFSAGLHPMQVKKKKKEMLTKMKENNTSLTTSYAEEFATRALGSACPRTRHDAIQRLQLYLSTCATTKGISYLNIKKLWKGMWYGLYMCDKVVVQDELSSHMAQLIWSVAGTIEGDLEEAEHYAKLEEQALLEEENEDDEEEVDEDDVEIIDAWDHNGVLQAPSDEDEVVTSSDEDEETEEEDDDDETDENCRHHTSVYLVCLFLKGYFETIHREWGNVDKHRVDKFYRSMRLMLSQVFQYCASREWHIGIIHMLNDTVFNEILCREQTVLKYPNGVRFHLIDIVLDELAKVSSGKTDNNNDNNLPINTVEFLAFLEPYLTIAMADSEKVVQARVMENILHKFLLQYSVLHTTNNNEEDPLLLLDHVHVESVAEQIFDIASNIDTSDRYRSSLYQMHKAYLRRIKDSAADKLDEEKSKNETAALLEESGPHTLLKDQGRSETDLEHDYVDEQSDENLSKKKKKKTKRKVSTSELGDEEVEQDKVALQSPSEGNASKAKSGSSQIPLKDQSSSTVNDSLLDDDKLETSRISSGDGEDSKSKRNKKRKKDTTTMENTGVRQQGKSDHVESEKIKIMDDRKGKKEEASLENVGVKQQRDADAVPLKAKSMDGKKRKKDCASFENVGVKPRETVDAVQLTNKSHLMDDKKRKKEDTSMESISVKQRETADAVPSKNKSHVMDDKKRKKDETSTENADVKQSETADAVSSKNKPHVMEMAKPEVSKVIEAAEPAVNKKKKKKKNKKKQNENSNLEFSTASKQLDDEIVISLREQSDFLINAVNSINASKKKKTAPESVPSLTKKQQKMIDDAVEEERQRRVKFGSVNRTKSYKASMTALQTMQHPTTATREPEKPILREPKYATSPVPTKGSPKNRFKASKGPGK